MCNLVRRAPQNLEKAAKNPVEKIALNPVTSVAVMGFSAPRLSHYVAHGSATGKSVAATPLCSTTPFATQLGVRPPCWGWAEVRVRQASLEGVV